jgi:2-(1,2-epoxy-1,2-dihydrophenyl)acetyl-CoA isomerase
MVLEVTLSDQVLELTLNRPDALNAFTAEVHEELASALKRARRERVGAVIITGAGRAFSAGQDLEEMRTPGTTPGALLERYYNPNIRAISELEAPVIAALNGVTAGAGLSLALACDLRIASEKTSFVPAFVAIGLIPDAGLSWFAPRLIGYSRAFEWLTSNRRLTAAEALTWGLVHEVVAPDDVLDRARARAHELAGQPGRAVAMTKRLLRGSLVATLPEQLEFERQLQQAASEHPAYTERVAAFLDKQPARAS